MHNILGHLQKARTAAAKSAPNDTLQDIIKGCETQGLPIDESKYTPENTNTWRKIKAYYGISEKRKPLPAKIYNNSGAAGMSPWHQGELAETSQENGEAWQEYRKALGSSHTLLPTTIFNESAIRAEEARQDQQDKNQATHQALPVDTTQNEEITAREVEAALKHSKPWKSAGDDSITNSILKKGGKPLTELLLALYTCIWQQGAHTPTAWTKVLIKPVYKNKDDEKNPQYYRVIALSSTIAKTFEKILDSRLWQYTTKHNTCTYSQYGSKLDHGTLDAIYPLITHIEREKQKGRAVFTGMIDFQTAFPSLWRQKLYSTLHDQGIRGNMLQALINLTKQHSVRVLHPSVRRDHIVNIDRGLTEGSALSPRLYSIFLANLLRALKEAFPQQTMLGSTTNKYIGVLAYVDDIALCASSQQQLLDMLTFVQTWAEDNQATINYGKSEVIVFNETVKAKSARGPTQWHAKSRFPYPHTRSLKEVSCFKYLGITLDSELKMDCHCNSMIRKIKIATNKA